MGLPNLLPPWVNSPYFFDLASSRMNGSQNNQRSLNMSSGPEKDLDGMGINGTRKFISLPTYNAIDAAKVDSYNGSYITMGQDAPEGPGTGKSATGAQAPSIDFVCGRVSAVADAAKNPDLYVNDDFIHDAVRIYMSQTTDLDKACKLVQGDNPKFENRSGAAIIADNVALKGRRGVKIVTSPHGDQNSKGGHISSGTGIELIANNDDSDLQPIVKGDNLIEAVNTIYKRINKLSNMIMDLAGDNIALYTVLGIHTHQVAPTPIGLLAAPSPELGIATGVSIGTNVNIGLIGGLSTKANVLFDELNYTYSLGDAYINSDFNRTS